MSPETPGSESHLNFHSFEEQMEFKQLPVRHQASKHPLMTGFYQLVSQIFQQRFIAEPIRGSTKNTYALYTQRTYICSACTENRQLCSIHVQKICARTKNTMCFACTKMHKEHNVFCTHREHNVFCMHKDAQRTQCVLHAQRTQCVLHAQRCTKNTKCFARTKNTKFSLRIRAHKCFACICRIITINGLFKLLAEFFGISSL